MNNKVLIQDGQSYINKCINKSLVQLMDHQKTQLLFHKFHGQLMHIYQTQKPAQVIWPISEYSQEIHDFINEYRECEVILLMDAVIDSDVDMTSFFNQCPNVKVIAPESRSSLYINCVATYDRCYDSYVFSFINHTKNNKTLAILSMDNDKNKILDPLIYPNANNPIVAINNPDFISPINIGIASPEHLSLMFNEYSAVIDLSGNYELECSACKINYIDYHADIVEAYNNQIFTDPIEDLENKSYEYLVKTQILSLIKGQS